MYARQATPAHRTNSKASAPACMIPDSPSIAARMWGTMPGVHPRAEIIPLRLPPPMALETVYTTPLPGIATTSEVNKNSIDMPEL